ncbi:uncharacterized protein LOC105192396 [Harpegnathos saltator]|uniref:Circadian clock-controlled protein n=1 Tax=Harpegnathos saltator TaxID=610380 RepID=E2B8X7_HARSA|nr:uncharacterized protein LOC105192396 [Harpegnathos saltator]EFN87854.1 hypothetical protein EAI_08001 [Harpegnathos saltator]
MRIILMFLIITCGLIAEMSANYLRERLPNLHICPRSQLQTCLPQSLDSMRPYLAQGVRRLGIPSFEPYYMEFYKITSRNRFIPLLKFRDTFVNGISNFTISNVKIANRKEYIQFFAHFPFVNVSTKLDGYSSLTIPFLKSSRYDINSNFSDVTADITIRGTKFEYEEDKEQYFSVDNVTVVFRNIGEMTTKKKQRGTPAYLTQVVNDYLLREWEALRSELNYRLEEVAAEIIQTVSSRIYTNFPLNMLMTR